MSFQGFDRDCFRFLRELKANNNRPWFQAHKTRYERNVRGPALALIEAMAPRLERLAPHLVADAGLNGGSMMRIHRDMRFSRDKAPYKTYMGVCFAHERAEDVHCPAFWLHVDPKTVLLAAGIWRADPEAVALIRRRIAAEPDEWLAVRNDRRLRAVFGGVTGDALKRPPRGFDADHPCIEDIKRKEFLAVATEKPAYLLREDFLTEACRVYRAAAPLMQFLSRALGLAW